VVFTEGFSVVAGSTDSYKSVVFAEG